MSTCASCGRRLQPDHRFCPSCGAAVDGAAEREARKVVSALFCDVVGSTALAERMDPEDFTELVGEAVARMARAVEAFGDSVVELATEHGAPGVGGVEITLPLSQDELAGWTGASREAVGKALHRMRGLGWVRTGRRRITVLDLEALRERAAL